MCNLWKKGNMFRRYKSNLLKGEESVKWGFHRWFSCGKLEWHHIFIREIPMRSRILGFWMWLEAPRNAWKPWIYSGCNHGMMIPSEELLREHLGGFPLSPPAPRRARRPRAYGNISAKHCEDQNQCFGADAASCCHLIPKSVLWHWCSFLLPPYSKHPRALWAASARNTAAITLSCECICRLVCWWPIRDRKSNSFVLKDLTTTVLTTINHY